MVAEAGGPVGFQTRMRYFGVDPLELRVQQAPTIKVDLAHRNVLLGEVVALELRHGELWAVARMNGEAPATDMPLFWSVATNWRRDGSDVVVERIAVTDEPAMTCAEPIVFLDGELSTRAVERWRVAPHVRAVLRNAAQDVGLRAQGESLLVRGATSHVDLAEQRAPSGPWWHGGSAKRPILSVR